MQSALSKYPGEVSNATQKRGLFQLQAHGVTGRAAGGLAGGCGGIEAMVDYKLGDTVDETLLCELHELRQEYKRARECLRNAANDMDDFAEALADFEEARKHINLWYDHPETYLASKINRWNVSDVAALNIALKYGQVDGEHHKTWVIDQMVRELTGLHYRTWVMKACEGEDGPDTYTWDTGIAP